MELPVATPESIKQLRVASETLRPTLARSMQAEHGWFRGLPQSRQKVLVNVASAGIAGFADWLENPKTRDLVPQRLLESSPQELIKSLSLQETLQLLKIVNAAIAELLPGDEITKELQGFALSYSFAAADLYSRASERGGLWDSQLEALIIDSIVSGEREQDISSRVNALGWRGRGSVAALIGTSTPEFDVDLMRKAARSHKADILVGTAATKLVTIIGFRDNELANGESFWRVATDLSQTFGAGKVILGPKVENVNLARKSVRSALSALAVSENLSFVDKLQRSRDFLAERALNGDQIAKQTLVSEVYEVLAEDNPELLRTLIHFFAAGNNLEATAKGLFVHPNTIRYRLTKIAKLIKLNPLDARESFTLRVSMTLGAIHDQNSGISR